MNKSVLKFSILMGCAAPIVTAGQESPVIEQGKPQAEWGIAVAVRTAEIPYPSENDTVSSFIPMLFYEGDRFFMRGIGGGIHLLEKDQLELNAIGRLRFVDLPFEYQNALQGDTVDYGLQLHQPIGPAWWEAEVLTESRGNWHANARIGRTHASNKWVVSYSLNARWGSSSFVSRYYGLEPLTGLTADSALILTPEIMARYKVISDLYLIGSLRYNAFGNSIRDLPTIDTSGTYEAWIGFGFFQDNGQPTVGHRIQYEETPKRATGLSPNLRIAHGWASPSNLADILVGNFDRDDYNNQMTSIFYHHPMTDRILGLPIEVFMGTGFAWHYASEVQDSTFELVAKLHFYYTFTWPIRWRFGVAEGFSWIEKVTYIEQENMDEKGYRPSQLMNYLDFTLDFNLGDLFRSSSLENAWLGFSVHHRSSIFESASQFGRIKGGSNYPSVYLQWDLP